MGTRMTRMRHTDEDEPADSPPCPEQISKNQLNAKSNGNGIFSGKGKKTTTGGKPSSKKCKR
jgi:hypothetical protein